MWNSILCTCVPVDSSAARMPFPGATILWAISCSSFFCSGVNAGYWWVMAAVRRKQWGSNVAFFYGMFNDDRRWCCCLAQLLSTACLCRWSMKRLSKPQQEKDICRRFRTLNHPKKWWKPRGCVLCVCFLQKDRVSMHKHASIFIRSAFPWFALPQLSSYISPPLPSHSQKPGRQQLCNMAPTLPLQRSL